MGAPGVPLGLNSNSNPEIPIDLRKKPDFTIYLSLLSLVVMLLIFILQANDVEMNWEFSMGAYIVLCLVGVWIFLKYAIPHLARKTRLLSTFGYFALFAALGWIGTTKQYRREHAPPTTAKTAPAQSLPPCPPGVGPNIDGFTTYGTTVAVEINGQPCLHLKNVRSVGGQKGLVVDPSKGETPSKSPK